MISNDFQNYLNNQYLAHSPNDNQGGSFWDTLPQQHIQEQIRKKEAEEKEAEMANKTTQPTKPLKPRKKIKVKYKKYRDTKKIAKQAKIAVAIGLGVLTVGNIITNTTAVDKAIKNSNNPILEGIADVFDKVPLIGKVDDALEKIPGLDNVIGEIYEPMFPIPNPRPIEEITEENVTYEDVCAYLDMLTLHDFYSFLNGEVDNFDEFSARFNFLESDIETYRDPNTNESIEGKLPLQTHYGDYYYVHFNYDAEAFETIENFDKPRFKVDKDVYEEFLSAWSPTWNIEHFELTQEIYDNVFGNNNYEMFGDYIGQMAYSTDWQLNKESIRDGSPEQYYTIINLIDNIMENNAEYFYNPYAINESHQLTNDSYAYINNSNAIVYTSKKHKDNDNQKHQSSLDDEMSM